MDSQINKCIYIYIWILLFGLYGSFGDLYGFMNIYWHPTPKTHHSMI